MTQIGNETMASRQEWALAVHDDHPHPDELRTLTKDRLVA